MADINTLDVILLSLVAILGIKGVINGLVKELFGLLGIVGGVYVASRYSQTAGELVSQTIFPMEGNSLITLVGFVLVLALFWLSMLLVGGLVSRLLDMSGFGGADRLFGFIFGAGKIFLIFSVIFYALSNVEIIRHNTQKYTQESLVYPLLLKTGGYIMEIEPSKLKEQMSTPPKSTP